MLLYLPVNIRMILSIIHATRRFLRACYAQSAAWKLSVLAQSYRTLSIVRSDAHKSRFCPRSLLP